MAQTQNWITKQDLINQFGEHDLPIDDSGDVSDVKIDKAIDTGVTQCEAYLRSTNITIPFSLNIQSELKLYVMDIVRYHYSNSLQTCTEDIVQRYQAALGYLNKITSGKVQLSESGDYTKNSLSVIKVCRG